VYDGSLVSCFFFCSNDDKVKRGKTLSNSWETQLFERGVKLKRF